MAPMTVTGRLPRFGGPVTESSLDIIYKLSIMSIWLKVQLY